MIACPGCKRKPSFREDKIASFALSIQCLKEHNLKKGSDYIKKKKKLPNFHESVRRKATQMVESFIEVEFDWPPFRTLRVESDNGYQFMLDDICHEPP